MSEHPFDEYLKALEKYQGGRLDDAAENIAHALGGSEVTTPIRLGLPAIFDRDSVLHEGVVNAIESEAGRRRRNARR